MGKENNVYTRDEQRWKTIVIFVFTHTMPYRREGERERMLAVLISLWRCKVAWAIIYIFSVTLEQRERKILYKSAAGLLKLFAG